MKLALKVVSAIAVLLVGSWLASEAFSLMNQPSDAAVAAGVLILLAMLAGVIAYGSRVYQKWFKGEEKTTNLKSVAALLLCVGALLFSGCTRIEAGKVGIKINLAGDQRGVDELPLRTGWVFYNPFTQQVFEYPTFVQTAVWTKDDAEGSPNNEEISFNSKEGLIITGDISLSYQVKPERVPFFYVKFRSDDLDTFTHGFLRNVARDQFNEIAGTYSVEDVYGPKKEEFITNVRARINAAVADIGVTIEQFGFIGAPRPPQQVIDALNSKVSATQDAMRAENELRKAKAEAEKQIAKARGEAESNRILALSITPQLLQWRQLEITQLAVAKWNGQRPMVEGQGGGGLLLQIPLQK